MMESISEILKRIPITEQDLKEKYTKINFIIETKEFVVVDGENEGEHIVEDVDIALSKIKSEKLAIGLFIGTLAIYFTSLWWLLEGI